MSKPFDATLNALIDLRASEWADCFARVAGMPPGPSTPMSTNLSSSLQADRLFRIDSDPPYLLHLELEANPRLGIPAELHRYNTLIDHRHDLPVETVLILLRPKAQVSDMTGLYQRHGPTGRPIVEFHYHIERVWKRPVEFWRERGIYLDAAFSLVTEEAERDLEGQALNLRERVRASGVDETIANALLNSSYFLCGLRYNWDMVTEIFRRLDMLLEESSTYQHVLEKGETKGQRRTLLRQGTKKFGPPSAAIADTLNAITDVQRLERLAERILDVRSWDELLAGE
jgi:hypothetical protein